GGLCLRFLGLAGVLLVARVQDREGGRRRDHPGEVDDHRGEDGARRREPLEAQADRRHAEGRCHERDSEEVEEGLVHAAAILASCPTGWALWASETARTAPRRPR